MRRINIRADFVAQADVRTPASTTGVWGDATGVGNFAFRIAATQTGAAIGTLTATATERSGDPGRYSTVFDAADLTTHLAAYVGRSVFVILSRPGDLDGLFWRHTVVDSQEGA